MTRGILIVGNESTLFSAISAEAAKRVESYASALIPNRLPQRDGALPPRMEAASGVIPLSWNPPSPVSARTLVLAAENRLAQINDAILVCSPPAIYRTAEALTPEEIEILVDDQIKGWFFLTRELLLYFHNRGSGSLSFVAPEVSPSGKNAQTDLLGPSAAACFVNYASGIFASSLTEPFQVTGFSGSETSDRGEFAAWLFKLIDEGTRKTSFRWNKFSKLGFLR